MKLNKNKVYDLTELTSEELKQIYKSTFEPSKMHKCLYYSYTDDKWIYSDTLDKSVTTNAKELFYTLKNVQVDCRTLEPIHIHNIVNIVDNKLDLYNHSFELDSNCIYFSFNKHCNLFGFYEYDKDQYEITYEKFMELFNVKEEGKSGWYKSTEKGRSKFLAYHDFKKGMKYGIDVLGCWFYQDDSIDAWYTGNLVKVTDQEAELRLIKEAVSRGFKKGATFNYKGSDVYCADDNIYLKDNVLYYGRYAIMENGVWAEIVKQETKPSQYNIGIDTFDRCEANMTKEEILACVRFNLDKYTWRLKGQDKEDFEKIIAYAEWGLKQLNK